MLIPRLVTQTFFVGVVILALSCSFSHGCGSFRTLQRQSCLADCFPSIVGMNTHLDICVTPSSVAGPARSESQLPNDTIMEPVTLDADSPNKPKTTRPITPPTIPSTMSIGTPYPPPFMTFPASHPAIKPMTTAQINPLSIAFPPSPPSWS